MPSSLFGQVRVLVIAIGVDAAVGGLSHDLRSLGVTGLGGAGGGRGPSRQTSEQETDEEAAVTARRAFTRLPCMGSWSFLVLLRRLISA
jgi:hypothetical protein